MYFDVRVGGRFNDITYLRERGKTEKVDSEIRKRKKKGIHLSWPPTYVPFDIPPALTSSSSSSSSLIYTARSR